MRRILMAACLGLAACSSATETHGPALDIRLSVDRTSIAPERPATVTISITNRSTEDVRVQDPRSYACFPPYSVIDRQGRSVELPGRACFAIAYAMLSIAPGSTMTLVDQWAGLRANGANDPVPVTPGEYQLTARVWVDDMFRSSAGTPIVVQ